MAGSVGQSIETKQNTHTQTLDKTNPNQNKTHLQKKRFSKDVVVDLVCYRRNGHNELDDARATLPLTCAAIDAHPPVLELYGRRLLAGGDVAEGELEGWRAAVDEGFEAEFQAARAGLYRESARQFLTATWQGDALAVRARGCSGRVAVGWKGRVGGVGMAAIGDWGVGSRCNRRRCPSLTSTSEHQTTPQTTPQNSPSPAPTATPRTSAKVCAACVLAFV